MAEQRDAPELGAKPYQSPSLRRLGVDRAEGAKPYVNGFETTYVSGTFTVTAGS